MAFKSRLHRLKVFLSCVEAYLESHFVLGTPLRILLHFHLILIGCGVAQMFTVTLEQVQMNDNT